MSSDASRGSLHSLALRQIEVVLAHLDESHRDYRQTRGARRRTKIDDEVRASIAILRGMVPEAQLPDPTEGGGGWHWQSLREALVALRGRLEGEELTRGASVDLAALHEWVATPARPLIAAGYYREAIEAAALRIDTELRERAAGMALYNVQLVRHLLRSNDKTPGPRLLASGLAGTPPSLAEQKALADLAAGAFAYIRNGVAHNSAEIDYLVAIECLATLSLVARALESCALIDGAES